MNNLYNVRGSQHSKLYNVIGGQHDNNLKQLKISADNRKQAIIRFMDRTNSAYHYNISADYICDMNDIITA